MDRVIAEMISDLRASPKTFDGPNAQVHYYRRAAYALAEEVERLTKILDGDADTETKWPFYPWSGQ